MTHGTGQMNARWPMVVVLMAGAFTTALNIAMISPLITSIATEFDISEAAAGQVATLTAAASGITALIVTPWMDRLPRRIWLRIEATLLLIGTVISMLAPGFGWLLVGRTVAGIGGAVVFGVCLAATSDLFPDPSRRNQVIGLVSTAATVSALVGLPLVTQVEALIGWRWAMAVLLVPLAIVLVGTRWLPGEGAKHGGPIWAEWRRGYRAVLGRGESMWLLGLMVVQAFLWFGWFIYLGAFGEEEYGMGPGLLSILFLTASAGDVLGSNIAPLWVRRWGARWVAAASSVVLAVNLLGVGVVFASQEALIIFAAIAGTAGGVLFLCINVLLLDSFPERRGAVMSLQAAGLEIGGALGTAAFGSALALSNNYSATYQMLGVFASCALLCLAMSARHARDSGHTVEATAP